MTRLELTVSTDGRARVLLTARDDARGRREIDDAAFAALQWADSAQVARVSRTAGYPGRR